MQRPHRRTPKTKSIEQAFADARHFLNDRRAKSPRIVKLIFVEAQANNLKEFLVRWRWNIKLKRWPAKVRPVRSGRNAATHWRSTLQGSGRLQKRSKRTRATGFRAFGWQAVRTPRPTAGFCVGSRTLSVHAACFTQCRHRKPRPNPSVEARPNGKPPSPGHRYGVHFLWPGLGVLPLAPPHLER